MTEKQWRIIDKEFISYTGGYAYVISNGDCGFRVWERKEDVQKVCDKLNELNDENQHIKNTIKEMLDNERTEIGKSVLKQLWEVIQ